MCTPHTNAGEERLSASWQTTVSYIAMRPLSTSTLWAAMAMSIKFGSRAHEAAQ